MTQKKAEDMITLVVKLFEMIEEFPPLRLILLKYLKTERAQDVENSNYLNN